MKIYEAWDELKEWLRETPHDYEGEFQPDTVLYKIEELENKYE